MLSSYDISMMENDVRDIIEMWNTRLTVLKPVQQDLQPNWNKYMHEYSGDIHYDRYDNVSFERKDQTNTNIYNNDIKNGAGDDGDGYLVYTTSDLNTFIDDTCRIIIDDSQWEIVEIRKRIGERLLLMSKIVGSNESWSNIPDHIIDCQAVV